MAQEQIQVVSLTVSMGEEKLAPHRYENFVVGPISMTVVVPDGMTVEDATKQALDLMKPAYDAMFLVQRDKYHQHHAIKG